MPLGRERSLGGSVAGFTGICLLLISELGKSVLVVLEISSQAATAQFRDLAHETRFLPHSKPRRSPSAAQLLAGVSVLLNTTSTVSQSVSQSADRAVSLPR